MSFALGVVLFAVGLGVSIALHEAGHMVTAKRFGMKVRRYFIGFGPTLFSFRRGETEYGLKAIPAGGFCDIAGMTAMDELPDPEDRRRAMWRYRTWKRVVVLSAGSLTHFILGILIIYFMAMSTGLPNLAQTPVVGEVSNCLPTSQNPDGTLTDCGPGDPAPARESGLQPGDEILAVGGTPTERFEDVVMATRDMRGPTPFLVERGGERITVTVDVTPVQRLPLDAAPGQGAELVTVGAVGLSNARTLTYGPLTAVPQTFQFTGTMFANTWEGLKRFPSRIPAVATAIFGGERAPDTPVSVVGASRLGGQAVAAGSWVFFLFLLTAFNIFVGVFNLLPLLPLDGGHIAVTCYEKVRNAIRHRRGQSAGAPVDYTRLLPVTYAFILVFVGIAALTITADIVNPIQLLQ